MAAASHTHRFDWTDELVTDPTCTRCGELHSVTTAARAARQADRHAATAALEAERGQFFIDRGPTYEQKLIAQENRRNRYRRTGR